MPDRERPRPLAARWLVLGRLATGDSNIAMRGRVGGPPMSSRPARVREIWKIRPTLSEDMAPLTAVAVAAALFPADDTAPLGAPFADYFGGNAAGGQGSSPTRRMGQSGSRTTLRPRRRIGRGS